MSDPEWRFERVEYGARMTSRTPQAPLRSEDVDMAAPSDPTSPFARFIGVEAHAVDADEAARLWQLSAELTGVDAFG